MEHSKLVLEIKKYIEMLQAKQFAYGRQKVSYLTMDDLIQPHDFDELNEDPEFRHLEGQVQGLQEALAMILAFHKAQLNS